MALRASRQALSVHFAGSLQLLCLEELPLQGLHLVNEPLLLTTLQLHGCLQLMNVALGCTCAWWARSGWIRHAAGGALECVHVVPDGAAREVHPWLCR